MSEKLRFDLTCPAMPEQYDVYLGEEKVGYVRLRHGHLSVSCPDVAGVDVYEAMPRGDGDFYDAAERDYHLRFAAQAILDWLAKGRPATRDVPPAPDVEYERTGGTPGWGVYDDEPVGEPSALTEITGAWPSGQGN